jgi:hypothetical protein
MIIFHINIDGIAFDPAECDPPVSTCIDCLAALLGTDERVKAQAGQIHVLRTGCVVECAQDVGDASRIPHAQPASVSGREEALQCFVSERPDQAALQGNAIQLSSITLRPSAILI